MDIAAFLVLIGLRGGDGKADVAVQLAQGQLRHLSHGGAALLDANEKICVRFFKNMRYEIVAFKTSIGYYQRFLRECVAFQHFNQRADFIFLWLRLNDDIGKGTVENVIKRRDMKLIYAVWNTVILNE